MIDKRGMGGKKGLGVQKDRLTRILKMPTIDRVQNNITISNIERFNTTQIHMGGWIKIDPEIEQNELNRVFYRAKRNIRYRLQNFARKTGRYHLQNIVILDTGVLSRYKKKNYQFLNIDLTLYNKVCIYDRAEIKAYIQPLLKDIIQNDLQDTNVFNFILKARGSGQYGE